MMNFAKGFIPVASKPEQIQRAEELLHYAELMHGNAQTFLQLKAQLTDKLQAHRSKMEQLLQQIYDLNSNTSQNVSEQEDIVSKMRQILQELYRELRAGRVLERQVAQFFQNANLSNYNPSIHQLRFSNNSETEQILTAKLDEIQRACRSVFRGIHYQ